MITTRASAASRRAAATHEAPDAGVARGEAVVVDQVLPDRHGVAARGARASAISSRYGSQALAVGARLALGGADGRWTPRRWWPVLRTPGSVDTSGVVAGFGGQGRGRPPRAADRDPGRLQVAAGRLATDARRLLDAPQRPAQSAQRQDLLLLVVAQDVGHAGEGPRAPRRRQRLGPATVVAGFQVSISGRFWVSTEAGRFCTHQCWAQSAASPYQPSGGSLTPLSHSAHDHRLELLIQIRDCDDGLNGDPSEAAFCSNLGVVDSVETSGSAQPVYDVQVRQMTGEIVDVGPAVCGNHGIHKDYACRVGRREVCHHRPPSSRQIAAEDVDTEPI